jgi:sigma-B regulation protein RsbU (phosphoserine phosphatase)
MAERNTGKRLLRVVTALALLAATGGALGFLATRLHNSTREDLDFVNAERIGVTYLKPLTVLMGELSSAGLAAVRGEQTDLGKVSAAAAAVDKAESIYGTQLGTTKRWADLSHGIEHLVNAKPQGAQAFADYADSSSLALALGAQVGDQSKLILDPELDSYYLMDVALLRLPKIITLSSRLACQAALSGKDSGKDIAGDIALQMGVDSYELAQLAREIGDNTRKAMDAASRADIGPNLTAVLDSFRSTIDQLAAPPSLRPEPRTWSAAALRQDADNLRTAALGLADAALAELDAILADRAGRLGTERSQSIVASVLGGVLVLLLLLWSFPSPRARHDADTAAGLDEDVAAVALDLPSIHPRDLLMTEELIHSGRGVRTRREADEHAR